MTRQSSNHRRSDPVIHRDSWLGRRQKWTSGFLICVVMFAGALLLYLTHAATPVASLEPESGTLATNATKVADSTASGGNAVKFKVASTPVYCGGRSFTAPAHCIGAAEWATFQCSTTTQCQAATFKCYAYMNADFTKIYDLSSFGGTHSGGKGAIVNPDMCGKDFYNIIRGQVPDSTSGTVPQNSKHIAVQNRTQSTFNSILTGSEYDPTKP